MNLRTRNMFRHAVRRALAAVGAAHVTAVILMKAYESTNTFPRKTSWLLELRQFMDSIPGRLFRAADYIDDRAPCPNCGKPEALVHLAKLKTYCWDCSYWGHDPSMKPKE